MNRETKAIEDVLHRFKIDPFVFVDNYIFGQLQEKEMMKQAMADIDNCAILIAETSEKAIGIGIEAGYAKGKGKPVIYLRKADAEHSTTVSGISDYKIVYVDITDLQKQLTDILIHHFG